MTLFLVTVITFIVFEIIPGDPIAAKLGIEADKVQIEALRKELQLDQPLIVRYKDWIGNALKGDLGISIRFDEPVINLIQIRMMVTSRLALIALVITIIIGVPLSIITAKYDNKGIGIGTSIFSQIGMALPSFWLGILMTYLFGLVLKQFIPGRYVPMEQNFVQGLNYLLYPAIAIAIPKIAVVVRYLRNAIMDQTNQDYVRTAYSKGLRSHQVMVRHILRNALIPVITIMGMIIADILGGSLIIEQVFTIPGIGRLLIMGISNRDFPLVQGMVIYIALIVIAINLLVDIMYHFIDPRIKLN